MTTDVLLSGIEAELARRCRLHADAALLAQLVAQGLGHAHSALELAREARPPADPRRTGALLAALGSLVPADELATLAALVALRPLLGRVAGRLGRDGLERDEAESVAVAAAVEAFAAGEAGRSPDAWRRLGSAVWHRARAALRAERRYRRVRTGPDALGDALLPAPGETAGSVLDWAVAVGVLEPRLARLITETRVVGRPLAEVAAEWAVPVSALASARRRAEARLRLALVADEAPE